MPRRKKLNGSTDPAEPVQPVSEPPAMGGNVTPERLRQFQREYRAQKAKVDEARGALGALCKAAESDGIDVKTFKQVEKISSLLPPEMDARIQTFTRYTTQLGLFDAIAEYRQAVDREDNEASVRQAEKANGHPKPNEADGLADDRREPKSGGALEAAYAQGFEAGEGEAARAINPYHDTDAHDAWDRGWHAGATKRVDAQNSARALA